MNNQVSEKAYTEFFESGGYKIAKLLVIKAEQPYEETSDDYDIMSMFKWKNHESEDSMHLVKKIHEDLKNQIEDIRLFMFALYDAMLLLPIDKAEALDIHYGRDTTSSIDPSEIKNKIIPMLFDILFRTKPIDYDFEKEGLLAIEQIERILTIGKTSTLNFPDEDDLDMIFPIENAMEASKAFKSPEFLVYTSSVQEMSAHAYDFDNTKSILQVKRKRVGNYFQIYSEDVDPKYVERYMYQLYADGKFMSMGLYPSFMEPAEKIKKIKDIDSLKILTKPKNFLGEEYTPDEATLGKTTRFTIQTLPQICDYVLLENGKEIARKKEPMFLIKKKPGSKYSIRLEKNDQRVEDILTIRDATRGLPSSKALLEKRTDVTTTYSLLVQMYDIALSMEIMKKYLPRKFARILKYRDTGKVERRIDVFWELSCLLIDPSFIIDDYR